jgi:NifB/MoaA-like Fe-S oxidoreductase
MTLIRKCPNCGEDTVSLITELRTGRRFCHACAPEEAGSAIIVARKIAEHRDVGTLDQYREEERLADLAGRPYVKPN